MAEYTEIHIAKPMWNGYSSSDLTRGMPCIGLSERRLLRAPMVKVWIDYEENIDPITHKGTKLWSEPFFVPSEEALMHYPKITVSGGVPLYVIPIHKYYKKPTAPRGIGKEIFDKAKEAADNLEKSKPKKQSRAKIKRMSDNKIEATIRPLWD
jgi:hypothetical protein